MTFKHFICASLTLFTLTACQTFHNMADDFNDLRQGTADYAPLHTVSYGANIPEKLIESPCPQVELVDDLSSISDFTHPAKMTPEFLVSRVDLGSAESTCKLSNSSAVVDLKLIFNGMLGPKGKIKSSDKPFFSYPYFIALTAPNGKIMAKEIFAAPLSFNANENEHVYFENLRQIIPIKNKTVANRYKILIGFQLSPEQLAYNRANMIPVATAEAIDDPQNTNAQ